MADGSARAVRQGRGGGAGRDGRISADCCWRRRQRRHRPSPAPCSATSPIRAAPPFPGATVTALETQTNISRTAVTNEAGNYIFSSLQNGTYTVDAELQGFKKVVRPNVQASTSTRPCAST